MFENKVLRICAGRRDLGTGSFGELYNAPSIMKMELKG
jgi:hypothetical protein